MADLMEISSGFAIDRIPFPLDERSTLIEKGLIDLLLKKNILPSCSGIPDYINHQGLYGGTENLEGEITLE